MGKGQMKVYCMTRKQNKISNVQKGLEFTVVITVNSCTCAFVDKQMLSKAKKNMSTDEMSSSPTITQHYLEYQKH